MSTELMTTLDAMSWALGEDSLNYVADFAMYDAHRMSGRPAEEILVATLGQKIVVGGTMPAGPADVVQSLAEALDYVGDDGSYPGRDYLKSVQFTQDRSRAMAQLNDFLRDAHRVTSFWLKKGHPLYPVFWDFAYVIEKSGDAYVFIGSSSD